MRRSRIAFTLVPLCLMLAHATLGRASEQAVAAADDVQYRQLEKLLVEIRQRNAGQFAITDPQGIDEARFIEVGGIEQWVKIRGRNRRNPVLLLLHGGPGHVTNPWSYALLAPWEERFTVVQWDQRGAGRTLSRNGPAIIPTLTLERMVQDGIELVQYLRRHLGKDKIVVVAHSFGTMLGLRMIARRPELFAAYVGTGQVADSRRTDLAAYHALLSAARDSDNQLAIAELTRNGPPPYESDGARITQRKWANVLEGADQFLFATLGWTLAAPDGSVRDINDTAAGERASAERLVPQTKSLGPRELGLQFSVPVFFFQGSRDYTTPTELARQYLESIEAPRKELVLMEAGGHFAVFTNADAFLRELLRRVRPLASASEDRK